MNSQKLTPVEYTVTPDPIPDKNNTRMEELNVKEQKIEDFKKQCEKINQQKAQAAIKFQRQKEINFFKNSKEINNKNNDKLYIKKQNLDKKHIYFTNQRGKTKTIKKMINIRE